MDIQLRTLKKRLINTLKNRPNACKKNFKSLGKNSHLSQKSYLMLEIRFSELAIAEMKRFIQLYEEGFFILYKDSGIWAVDAIIDNYRQSAKRINEKIFSEIEYKLKNKKVLGRKENNKWNELSFYVDERLIMVYFSEDKKNKIRWIESIGIDRKPIIF